MEDEKRDIKKDNTVAAILKGLSVFIGLIGSFIGVSQLEWYTEEGIIIIAISIISALLLYAFGEVIELLQDIKNKL